MAELDPRIFPACAFVLGALIGSFLNVVIARVPKGLSVVRPASRCPHCGYSIPWFLNVPILSWLALRGRCADCAARISVRYPLVELLTALLFLGIAMRFGPTWACLMSVVLAAALVAITFIDIDTFEISDEIVLPGIVLGVLLRPFAFSAPWWEGLAGAALGAGALWMVRFVGSAVMKQEAMGFGDVKLIAMIGGFLGMSSLLPVILLASISGTVFGSIDLLVRRARQKAEPDSGARPSLAPAAPTEDEEDEDDWVPGPTTVPFGPYLALGAVAYILFGTELVRLFHGWTTI